MRGAQLLCDCGTAYEVALSNLIKTEANNPARSCGCIKRERMAALARSAEGRARSAANGKANTQLAITPGDRFGRGVVLEEIRMPDGSRGVRLLCDCGTAYETPVKKLTQSDYPRRSCGCLGRERRAAAMTRIRQPLTTHGLSRHPLYSTWKNMMARCYSPKYRDFKNYGGRDITVCPRWHDPALFIEDILRLIGPRPPGKSLDRYPDNDGNYEEGNVRWATDEEQARNTRPYLTRHHPSPPV